MKRSKKIDAILANIPTQEEVEAVIPSRLRRDREGRVDEQLASLWAANMRFSYSRIQEVEYPAYMFHDGKVLPIDDSLDPAASEWEYYSMDGVGQAAWIGDDGESINANAITVQRRTGEAHEMGHKWDVTIFDMERFGAQGRLGSPVVIPVIAAKQKVARESHAAKSNWIWGFGSASKALLGLCNHPNINVTLAPIKASGGLRVWDANATNDEILADVAVAINTIPESTQELHFAKVFFMPPSLLRLLRDRRLGAGDGFASLLDLIKDRYGGDDTGQGKVEFRQLRECAAVNRSNPETGSDDSGITGDFLLILPEASTDEASFVRARKFTQRPPEERDMKLIHNTHSKIGGCKLQIPTAVHRFDFGA